MATGAEQIFGLRVGSSSGPRATTIERVEQDVFDSRWPERGTEPLLTRRFPDGRLVLAVERHESAGYRVDAPGYGRDVVSADGRRICRLGGTSPLRARRLLFAQTLPLAASLQGLDLLHASAVVLDGRLVAFVASSGTGKTSLAAHLVAEGAAFFTDDVLAADVVGRSVVAYPGPRSTSLDETEWQSMPPAGRARLGRAVGLDDGKVQIETTETGSPRELAALYFLERNGAAGRLRVEPLTEEQERLLLGTNFLAYLREPSYLLKHLEVCAAIARTAAIFRVAVPAGLGARALAERVAGHAEEAA